MARHNTVTQTAGQPTRPQTRLLIDEPPLMVLPGLATLIGLNEAIVLQQIHYWLQKSTHIVDGRPWIYNTLIQWQGQFPFWSASTVRRTLENLEEAGLIITGNYNTLTLDRTKWYTINYTVVATLDIDGAPAPPSAEFNAPFVQSEQIVPHLLNLSRPSAQNEQPKTPERATQDSNLNKPIPETPTETPTETSRRDPSKPQPPVDQANEAESAPPYSPYIAGIIIDYMRQLGDLANPTGQATRALRLWQQSGLTETAFVEQLHATYKLVRLNQTHVANKGAWYFTALANACGVSEAQHDPERLQPPNGRQPDPPAGP